MISEKISCNRIKRNFRNHWIRDILNQVKFLLNVIQLRIKLKFHPNWCIVLWIKPRLKKEFKHATLLVDNVHIFPEVKISHSKVLENSNIRTKCPLTKLRVKTDTLPKDITDTIFTNLFYDMI